MKVWKVKLNKRKPKLKRLFLASVLVLLVVLQVATVFSFNQQTYAETMPVLVKTGLNLDVDYDALLTVVDNKEISTIMSLKAEYEEKERIAIERAENISTLVAFLKKQKSPVATEAYATQIINLAEANKADYRIIVAIMGVESGFCRAPLKIGGSSSYNCFGYLNGVKYTSFTDAFNSLIPKIAVQYANRYGWDFVSLAKAYGQLGWEKTSADMLRYANAL